MPAKHSENDSLGEDLSAVGLRATRQRVAVLGLLRREENHPTCTELFDRLRSQDKSLSQKTVYQILDALVEAGLASRVTATGEPYRYEAMREPHLHAECRVCARLIDVPTSKKASVPKQASLPRGFQVEQVEILISGVCSRCRRNN